MKKLHILFLVALFAFSAGLGGCIDFGGDDEGNDNPSNGDEDSEGSDSSNPYTNPTTCSGSCTANETTCLPNGAGGYTWCICPPTTLVWSPQDCSTRCGDDPVIGCADDPTDSLGNKQVCICGDATANKCGNSVLESGEECEPGVAACTEEGEVCNSTTCMCVPQGQEGCGDGTINGTEECEPNDLSNCETDQICRNCMCAYESDPYCGDGNIDENEECEPTNLSNCTTGQTCNSITCQCQGGTNPYCGDSVVNGTEECEPNDTSNCGTNETCNSTTCMCEGGETYCGDGTVNGTEECEPTDLTNCSTGQSCNSITCVCQGGGTETGTCIAFGETTLQCRQQCNPQSHSCGEDFMCYGYVAMNSSNQLILGGGSCQYLASTQTEWDNWWNSLADCGSDGSCATGTVCLGSDPGKCLTECNITSDTCPSGYLPGYESYNEIPWACVRYSDGSGNYTGLCDPWGDAPTCSSQGASCDPNP